MQGWGLFPEGRTRYARLGDLGVSGETWGCLVDSLCGQAIRGHGRPPVRAADRGGRQVCVPVADRLLSSSPRCRSDRKDRAACFLRSIGRAVIARRWLWGVGSDFGGLGLDEAFADREAGEVDAVVDVELGHEARRVVVDGLDGDVHRGTDLLLGQAFGDVAKDLELSW